MAKVKRASIYVVQYDGKDHLVRAHSHRKAMTPFVDQFIDKMRETTRVAGAEDVAALMEQGEKVLDVTTETTSTVDTLA